MLGIDVSNNQGRLDWKSLKNHGVKFAFAKATEGHTYKDSLFAHNRRECKRLAIPFGAYHFARPDLHPSTPQVEAANFCREIGGLRKGELYPVLDFEVHPHITAHEAVVWCRKFNKVVKEKLGVYPLFYSYSSFIDWLNPDKPLGSGLWLADYGSNNGQHHPVRVPHPWKKVIIHQYTSNGHIPGFNQRFDLNHSSGLRAFDVSGQGV